MRSRTAEAIASTPRWSPSRTVASSATLPAQRFHGREAELRDALLGWRVQLAEWLHVGGAQLRVVAHRIDHRLDLTQRAHGRIVSFFMVPRLQAAMLLLYPALFRVDALGNDAELGPSHV